MTQEHYDLRKIKIGEYITLACGLGFTVSTVMVKDDNVFLEVYRYDKQKQCEVRKALSFTADGFYSPTKEPTMYDVVRVSDLTRTPYPTKAGTLDFNINLIKQLGQDCIQRKVRTRNNYWFNVNHIAYDKDTDLFSIKMGNITSGNESAKVNMYYNNGKSAAAVESCGTYYSPFDIIEVQVL